MMALISLWMSWAFDKECPFATHQLVLISPPLLLQAQANMRMLSNRAYLRVRAHYSGGLLRSPPS